MGLKIYALVAIATASANAAVVCLEVTEHSPVAFGYEHLKGRVFFAIDPNHPGNRGIVDVRLAPRNRSGMVEFSADFQALRPANQKRANGTILFEVVNRGKLGVLAMFNRAPSDSSGTFGDLGDGLLMKEGYSVVWVGWQHDVPKKPGLMRLVAPTAGGVTGWVRAEYTANKAVNHWSLGDAGHVPYRPIHPQSAKLTVRDEIYGPRTLIPHGAWHFENGTEVQMETPATPGRIYEVVYESNNPVVAGLGLAAIRDLISHLKTEWHANSAIGFGVSQSAMVLREFLYEGFNRDERGSRVFDGVFAHVAGARRSTFERFAQPSRTAGPLRNASLSPTEQAPFTDSELLARARKDGVAPKVFHTNSTYEYWGSGASLTHTSPDGSRDLELPSTSRIYVFSGGQHGPAAFPPRASGGQNLPNFNDYRWAMRALLGQLRAWVESSAEPAGSVYPTIRSHELVDLASYSLPGSDTPKVIHTPHVLDFGGRFTSRGIAERQPPLIGRSLRTVVPRADADGNDVGGIRMPEVSCAIAAYTGWNLRSADIGASRYLLGNTGSYLPFSNLKIEKKFADEGAYLACVEASAVDLSERRFVLSDDIPALKNAASRHWRWRMQTSLSGLLNQ